MQGNPIIILLVAGLSMFGVIGLLAMLAHYYTLNGIKSRAVGDGQHGTARWATKVDIRGAYSEVAFEPEIWRQGRNLPTIQGLVVGWQRTLGGRFLALHASPHGYALVDNGDIHCLMIGAAGVGKTANFLYPNIEYACASGMSFLCTDTKGVRPDRVQ